MEYEYGHKTREARWGQSSHEFTKGELHFVIEADQYSNLQVWTWKLRGDVYKVEFATYQWRGQGAFGKSARYILDAGSAYIRDFGVAWVSGASWSWNVIGHVGSVEAYTDPYTPSAGEQLTIKWYNRPRTKSRHYMTVGCEAH